MGIPTAPSKSDRETFDIARAKARDDTERARVDELWAMLAELRLKEARSVEEHLESRRKRGEKVKPLTKSQQEFVDDLDGDDAGLDPYLRKGLAKEPTAAKVLQSIAYGAWFGVLSRRGMLRYCEHPDQAAIEQRLIDFNVRLAEALFAFIADPKFRRYVEREVADMQVRISGSGGGSAFYVLLDVENDEDTKTNGKEIGRAYERLEGYAQELEVTPLSEFLGFGERGSSDWFEPAAGLKTFEALIAHVGKASTKVKGKKALIADLEEAAGVLRSARERKAKFHIEIDI
jgi:hypothetical protein